MSVQNITLKTTHGDVPTVYLPGCPESPLVVYHHGLYGSKNGDHAQRLMQRAEQAGIGFVAFDNLGHGASSVPLESGDLSTWITTAKDVIEQNPDRNTNLILIGNSVGAGILFEAARISEDSNNVVGFLGISAAPDAVHEEIQAGLSHILSSDDHKDLKAAYQDRETIQVPFLGVAHTVPLSQSFFTVAENHRVLGTGKELACSAILVHGKADASIPFEKAGRFSTCFTPKAEVLAVDDGHSLCESTNVIDHAFDRLTRELVT